MSSATNEPTIPSPEEALLARQVSRALEAHHAEHALRVLVAGDGDDMPPLELPPVAAELLIEILKQTDGNAVTLTPVKPEITTQEAADLLNVSRPFVIGLIEKGRLPVRMVGNHRRLPLSDVLAYKAETKANAYAALQEIASLDQELGLR
jgi:excisionase family DNA binding protein